MADQDISVGIKISDDLIKAAVSMQIAKQLGNPVQVLADIVKSVLNMKKDSYSSTPTYLTELVMNSLKPIAKQEWEKYLSEIEPDLRKMVSHFVRDRIMKERLLKSVEEALVKAFEIFMDIKFQAKQY